MSIAALESAAASLYETDMAAWADGMSDLLRSGAPLTATDREQLAEEIKGMANKDRRELRSRAANLLMHLLKIRFEPDKHTRSWDITVANERKEIEFIFEDSPSLRTGLREQLPAIYKRGRKLAEIETGLDIFPEQNPFTLEEILDHLQ